MRQSAPLAVLPHSLAGATCAVGPVPDDLGPRATAGVLWSAQPGRFLLDVPDVARYLVAGGRSITIEPARHSAEAGVARFARATPLAALCYQRGMAVFHAAAAGCASGAVLLVGDSAAGKSTLLAGLVSRGWSVLCDDVAPVRLCERGEAEVLPTYPDVVLWPDAVARLAPETPPTSGPRSLPAGRFASRPLPLRAIWWLSTHSGDGVRVEVVDGLDRLDALARTTYNRRVAHALLDRLTHLHIWSAVASLPVQRLRRPRGRWSLEQLVDLVDSRDARAD